MAVTGQFNYIAFDRQVFGVSPDDLEPCELPGPDEVLGAVITQAQAIKQTDLIRKLAGITRKDES